MISKRLLIIGSSMAMPRNEIKYEETWIYKLKKEFPNFEIIDKSRRASTTLRLVTEGGSTGSEIFPRGSDLLEYYRPDVVIMQIGITDCAPRYVNKKKIIIKLINNSPGFIKSKYYNYIKKHTVRKPKNAYVTIEEFNNNLNNYFERAAKINAKIIVIEIAKVTNSFISKSPFINKSIENYNTIFSEISNKYKNVIVINPFDKNVDIEKIAIDEFHVNEVGHKYVFNSLKNKIIND